MTLDEIAKKFDILDKRLRDELGAKSFGITLDSNFKAETEEDKIKLYLTVIDVLEKLLDGELVEVDSVGDAPGDDA